MSDFLERFRNKTSTIGKMGDIALDKTKAVNSSQQVSVPNGKPPINPLANRGQFQSSGQSIISNLSRFNQTESTSFARPIRLTGGESAQAMRSSYDIALMMDIKETQSEYVPMPNTQYTDDAEPPNDELTPRQSVIQSNRRAPITSAKRMYSAQDGVKKTLYRPPPKVSKSVNTPLRQIAEEAPEPPPISIPKPPRREVEYKPYTLQEYKQKHNSGYVKLGGLGAGNIGTEVWTGKKSLYDKRKDYAVAVQSSNTSRLNTRNSTVRRGTSPDPNPAYVMRQKALEFAKKITRPKLKPPKPQISPRPQEMNAASIQFLEAEHAKYQSTLEALRAKLELC